MSNEQDTTYDPSQPLSLANNAFTTAETRDFSDRSDLRERRNKRGSRTAALAVVAGALLVSSLTASSAQGAESHSQEATDRTPAPLVSGPHTPTPERTLQV